MTSVAKGVEAVTFPGSARLRSPKDFQATFSQGRRISAALFRLHVRAAEDPEKPARLGISVPKRIAAHAVERNRIKRLVRESFRHLRTRLPSADYALLAQRGTAGASADMLRAALAELWERAGALKRVDPAPTIRDSAPQSG